MSDLTIVTACTRGYLWGAWLLVASLRRSAVQAGIHVLERGFGEQDRALIEQFPATRVIAMSGDDPRTLAVRKPEALLTASLTIPVPSSFNWTAAPGMTASLLSLTVPMMAPVTLTCAAAVLGRASARPRASRMTLHVFMVLLCGARVRWCASDGGGRLAARL